MLALSIDGKSFIATENAHGRSGVGTVFRYAVDEVGAITGSYSGGEIHHGQLVGRVTGDVTIEMRFQCITTGGELLSGSSRGTVSRDGAGLMHLDFEWEWLSGDTGGGTSRYVEATGG